MKKIISLCVFFLYALVSFAQKDQITEMLDSLERVYYFKEIKLKENTINNYAPGYIPKFDDKTYNSRLAEMVKNSPFNYVYNPTVRSYIDKYTSNPPKRRRYISFKQFLFPIV